MSYRVKSVWPRKDGARETHWSTGLSNVNAANVVAGGHAKGGALSVEVIEAQETIGDVLSMLREHIRYAEVKRHIVTDGSEAANWGAVAEVLRRAAVEIEEVTK